jgi:CheY-like chemotaxis protein
MSGATAEKAPGDLTVLVVDDSTETADALVSLLEIMGYNAFARYDGLSAIEAARARRPEVVICDINMPGTDGYETASGILALKQTPRPCLIAYTALHHSEDRRATARAGYDLHLTKPISAQLLEEALARVCNGLPLPDREQEAAPHERAHVEPAPAAGYSPR